MVPVRTMPVRFGQSHSWQKHSRQKHAWKTVGTPFLIMVLLTVIMSGCSTVGGTYSRSVPLPAVVKDGAPREVPADLANLPDPVPRHEPPSRYGNPANYTVAGRTYFVMKTAAGYAETGLASWYGTKFHGQRTSSGEPYDMLALTAAHKTLPIPTYAQVVNLDNGRKTIVRINDRGPFHDDRIIDLSYAAAVKLGYHGAGTARVRVEAINFEPVDTSRSYTLQAGAFAELASADALQARLKAMIDHPVLVVQTPSDHLYRVRIGPVKGESAVEDLKTLMQAHQLGHPMVLEGS